MEPQIEILLDDKDLVLHPGQVLRGGWRLNAASAVPVKKAELFVMWSTEGKGDADSGAAYHQVAVEDAELDAGRAFTFETTLPHAPWSYAGKLIKINWYVRVYVLPREGQPFAAEERFKLLPQGRPSGAVEPPEPVFGQTPENA